MDETEVSGEQIRETVSNRADVLATLEANTSRKPMLVEELDVSRSTVDRAIGELIDAGLAENEEGVYRATRTGRQAIGVYREYADLTDDIATAEAITEALPPAAPFDVTLLEHADIRLAASHAPESALSGAVSMLKEVNTLRGFAPVIKSNYASLLYRELIGRGLDIELIIEDQSRESLATLADEWNELAELLAADEVTILKTDTNLPYALWIMSDRNREAAGVTVHESGSIVGTITNDSRDAVQWCRQQYESIRTDAEPLDLLDG
jgi:predicted transcriptional regulator